jgi:hypothetical protein
MPLDPQVHEWLDVWEQSQMQDRFLDLEQFISRVCGPAPAEQVQDFRRAVQALAWMDALLLRLGNTGPPNHTHQSRAEA